MTETHNPIDHVQIVREGDIDRLLCEEVAVVPDFATWLAGRVIGPSSQNCVMIDAWTPVLRFVWRVRYLLKSKELAGQKVLAQDEARHTEAKEE